METTTITVNDKHENISSKYYMEGAYVLNDENEDCEFKGHKDMTMKDVSSRAFFKEGDKLLMSHQPISRTFCSFLNTGYGGVIHIGILDDGKIKGIRLTQYQRDHMKLSLKSLALHFTPSVHEHQYQLKFIPVVKEKAEIEKILSEPVETVRRACSHVIETPKFCWCDREAIAKEKMGKTSFSFVIEVTVKPFDQNDPRNQHLVVTKMPLHPIYQNEEGFCYIRYQGSIIKYDMDQIVEMTKQEVSSFYQNELKSVLKQLSKECDEEITAEHCMEDIYRV